MNFRRWITALAVLALFTGLASAQVNVGGAQGEGPLICVANVAAPPQLRAEGYTELIGDIVITCTGGTRAGLPAGTTIPTTNITVSLGTNVTSRLLASGGVSEALLLIDEPGSSVGGAGTVIPQSLCSSAAFGAGPGGCPQTVPVEGTAVATNVFQGIVSGNQVIFNGIPILPPASAGQGRVYRITNIRANVAGLGGAGLPGTSQLLASVSTTLQLSNPVLIAGFIQNGLSTSAPSAGNIAQCGGSGDPVRLTSQGRSGLSFTEGFATAFKTRVAVIAGVNDNGQSGSVLQNIPGTIYNSESGFIAAAPAGSGLADFGTRLKAVFNNVPSTVRIFVSTANINNTTATSPQARLVISETAPISNNAIPAASSSTSVDGINVAELAVVNGTATAVWEVTAANSAATEALIFGVYQRFAANPGANLPTPGTATVNLSFAPTPTAAFSASDAAGASRTLPIPRFADTSSASNIFTIAPCQTALLFPFVTSSGGFDTGIAIANTTTDPFGTRNQSGTCTLNFYGASPNPAAFTTASVATGTVYSDLISARAGQNFTGYMIAVCNFQLAHGFAFVSDIGARNLAMGYLALVLESPTGNRNNRNEALNN